MGLLVEDFLALWRGIKNIFTYQHNRQLLQKGMLQVYGKSEKKRNAFYSLIGGLFENGGNMFLGIGPQYSIVLSIINWIVLSDNRSSEILIRLFIKSTIVKY